MTGDYYLWYVSGGAGAPPLPLGVYDSPSPEPGVSSLKIGDSEIPRLLQKATSWAKTITDLGLDGYKVLRYLP